VKAGVLAALALASVLSVGLVRQVTTGARAMQASDEAQSAGDARGAIDGARAAAEALLPGSPYPRRGMERLAQIGRDAEARGDDALAAVAWRAMRTAAEETRSLGGGDAWLTEANAGLARVAAKETPAPPLEGALATRIGPSPVELLLFAAIPFALYAAVSRFLRYGRTKV
jgi:hypothetical protein